MEIVQKLITNSKNFTVGRQSKAIAGIILHTEGQPNKDNSNEDHSLYDWFNTNSKQVSAHYFVTFSGKIEQYVLDENTAYHAGNWDFNVRTIGIEHQDNGYWDTGEKYTDAEYESSAQLVATLCLKYGIPVIHNPDGNTYSGIRLHKEVPGKSTGCPDALDWGRIITRAQVIAAEEINKGCRNVWAEIIKLILENLSRLTLRRK